MSHSRVCHASSATAGWLLLSRLRPEAKRSRGSATSETRREGDALREPDGFLEADAKAARRVQWEPPVTVDGVGKATIAREHDVAHVRELRRFSRERRPRVWRVARNAEREEHGQARGREERDGRRGRGVASESHPFGVGGATARCNRQGVASTSGGACAVLQRENHERNR